MSKIIIFSAPSGSGKSTIINYLMQQGLNLHFSVVPRVVQNRMAWSITSLRQKTLSNVSRKVSFWNTKRYTKTAFTER